MLEVRQDPERLLTEALTGWRRVEGSEGWLLDHHATYSTDPGLRGPGGSMAVPGATWLATLAVSSFEYRRRNGVDTGPALPSDWFHEETAYLLDLTHTRPEPIVVTGAMRNPTLASPDGPANLLAAIQTAASADARDFGALVVFAEEIHAAARVRKTHSTSGHTFASANGGPLGYLVEGQGPHPAAPPC